MLGALVNKFMVVRGNLYPDALLDLFVGHGICVKGALNILKDSLFYKILTTAIFYRRFGNLSNLRALFATIDKIAKMVYNMRYLKNG